MAAAGCVGVGELVDEDEGGAAGEDGVEVHLLEDAAAVVDAAAGDDLEAADERLGLGAAVGLDDADRDVDAVLLPGAGRGQHGVGLADPGGGAEEDLQPAARLAQRLLEQGVRGRTLVVSLGHGARLLTGGRDRQGQG